MSVLPGRVESQLTFVGRLLGRGDLEFCDGIWKTGPCCCAEVGWIALSISAQLLGLLIPGVLSATMGYSNTCPR